NPWGLSFDSVTGHLWCADVGEHLWEEINKVDKGANYGWSDRDGPTKSIFHQESFKSPIPLTEPVHAYSRMRGEGICIVGGVVYRGSGMPSLNGAFIFADWGYGTVWALQTDPQSGEAVRRLVLHRNTQGEKFNPTLITTDATGEPILLSQEGNLYQIQDESD
ncbi:MAG TPA: PQQ-dependent sugar dehydrogenase, partial [Prosthecobacter sp.]|nr:PQQ-dependent sugar dehydrogenase [Prosthecobacter sp.]